MTFKVFGYGSLVNRATLPPYVAAEQHVAGGYRRAWRVAGMTPRGGACALNVRVEPEGEIEGVIFTFADEVWPLILERERRYDGVPLDGRPDVTLFVGKPDVDRWADDAHPVHLSYIDTTLQGYLREFGEAGARCFMTSTDGWHCPIVNDRAAPRYPRARHVSEAERATIDRLLGEIAGRDVADLPRKAGDAPAALSA